ncbi:MAG: hypothetical protein ACFE9R_16835, partial [Candidatus Hermodarchaeota archaeon]
MEVLIITKLFKGIVRGTVTSDVHFGATSDPFYRHYIFSIKLDKKIDGIPEEFMVESQKRAGIGIVIRKNDIVLVDGEIRREKVKHFQVDFICMLSSHIFNETL